MVKDNSYLKEFYPFDYIVKGIDNNPTSCK